MKSLFLSVLAFFMVQFSYAQWKLDSLGNYYLPSGTVSVGPSVATGFKFTVEGWGNLVNFSNLADQDINFLITPPGASDKYSLICPSTPGSLALGVAGYEKMRITNDGYVGIGMSTPSEKLDVNGNITNGNGQWYTSRTTSGTSVQMLGIGSSNNIYIGDLFGRIPSNNLVLRTNGTDRMVISSNGYIGFGTDSPHTLLSLQGDNQAISVAQSGANYNNNPIGAEFGSWGNDYTSAAGIKFHRWMGTGTFYGTAYWPGI
jgi:hypothetical protein